MAKKIKKKTTVATYLPTDLYNYVRALVKDSETNMSHMIRLIVKQHMEMISAKKVA